MGLLAPFVRFFTALTAARHHADALGLLARGGARSRRGLACRCADQHQILARRTPRRARGLVPRPQDRGYFKTEGLDVVIDDAVSPLDPITARRFRRLRASAFADINALIKYRDQHPSAPLKAVFMVYNKPPYAIVARKSRGITEPKQLENKKLGAPTAGSTFAQWPLFAKLNNIDMSKVTIEKIGIPVRAPMLAAGQIDAALGSSFRLYVDLKDRGVPVDDIVLMPMANYGMKLYGNAVVVNSKFAGEKPDAVKDFLRAFNRGLKQTIRNPAEAVESILKRNDAARKEVELERLRMAITDNILTPEVRANGLGAIEMARLEQSMEQIGSRLYVQSQAEAGRHFRRLVPAATRPAQDQLMA